MKKNTVIAIILLAIVGGCLTYYFKFQNKKLSPWSFIPSDALAVYQSSNFLTDWGTLSEQKIWKNLLNTAGLSKLNQNINTLDSISAHTNGLQELMGGQMILASAHSISKHDIDFLFVIGINNVNQHNLIAQLLSKFEEDEGFTFNTRIYLGHQITEVSINGENKFSYIFFKNFFVGSFTSFLIEDAIRTVDDDDLNNYYENTEAFEKLSTIDKDNGNLYINATRLDVLLETFGDPLTSSSNEFASLIDQSLLDVEVSDNHILLTGFSFATSAKPNYLEIFNSSKSSALSIVDIVPNNTAALIHYSFDDFAEWHKNLKDYWRKVAPERLTNIGELENRYNLNLAELYRVMGNEVGLVMIESGLTSKPDLITYLKSDRPEELIGILDNISAESTSGEYEEVYLDKTIRQIDLKEMPSRLFGNPFLGYESTFYVRHDDCLLLANNERTLKSILDYIQAEQTWGKSIKTNNFLDVTNKEANLSLFINTNKALNMMKNRLNQEWVSVWEEHTRVFKQIEFVAFQFTQIDGKYYTNIAAQHPGGLVEQESNVDFNVLATVEVEDNIITKPMPVRNHNNRNLEMLIQESSNDLYLISNDQDITFEHAINGPINSRVDQLDYYKNNKLQYLFSTTSSVHILDRTGTYLPDYPIQIPGDSPISYLSLIDYDESKNYRIMIATENGDYYLMDKNGRFLEGWNPKSFTKAPAQEGFHLRVKSKDYLLFSATDGTINVLNRRGQNRPGFPLDLEAKVSNPLFVRKGAVSGNTTLTAISDDGELISFNLKGQITKREHIYRASVEDKYHLTVSSNNRLFSILRYNDQEASVLNQDGEEVFKHQYSVSTDMRMQHYIFGPGNEVFVIIDRDQEFTYLYDQNGNMLHLQPLQSGNEIAMLYFENENIYKLYATYMNKLQTLTIDRR